MITEKHIKNIFYFIFGLLLAISLTNLVLTIFFHFDQNTRIDMNKTLILTDYYDEEKSMRIWSRSQFIIIVINAMLFIFLPIIFFRNNVLNHPWVSWRLIMVIMLLSIMIICLMYFILNPNAILSWHKMLFPELDSSVSWNMTGICFLIAHIIFVIFSSGCIIVGSVGRIIQTEETDNKV